ncbi:glycosyl transferase family group 2-domain-containing protein [Paraphysoderma sedebokerense]|nr:glycosyl transferase family group 2-domain-containing protein [Paraphysoderma sedebokerense]
MLLDSKKKVEEKDQTKAAKRLTYVDGLRGIAVSIFFAHQFAEYTFAKVYPDVLSEGTFQYILRNGQFALALLFLLSGRVTPLNFLRKFATSPSLLTTVPKSKQPLKKFTPLSAPANTYFDYIQSMWRRLLQLALPVFVVIIIQYKVCDDGLTDAADQAEQFLRSTTLRKPNWCLVGTEGIGAFLVDVFSNRNHKYVLDLGSNLWTIYIQMWGTMFAYILAMIAVYIPRRRPLFYTVVVFWTWYTYNFNMLFAVGVILADLDITGHYKRFSSSKYTKWYKCLAVEISLVILSVSILTSYVLANALDDFAMWVTVREGVIGFAREFPVAMYPSRWLPAVLVLLWLDLSPVTQWFVGSWIFRIVGKVSTGFYLMHMTLVFGLFPKMFLSLRETNNVWNTLIISFVVIYILLIPISYAFYYLVEKLGANVADFSFAYLFVKPSTHISKLPAKLFTSLSATIPHLPSIIAGFFKSKYASFKAIFERPKGNPTRPPHDYGIRENVLPEELHSTFWDYDLSDDKDAMRTERLLRFNSYLAPAHFVGILGVALTWFFLNPIGPYNPEQVLNFASLWRSIWLLSIPYVVITFIGFSTPRIAKTKAEMDKQPVLRQYVRNFYIAIVTQGSNEEAVRRGYEKMKPLARCHPSIRVVVLTDEPYSYPDLDNFVCPKAYRSEMGKAKHKARALDYFRKAAGLTQYDWVLHMDEESTIDAASLRRCFDFIRYSPHHFGQGVILYNAYSYWSNPFFTVADAIRVGDDLARFSLQYLIFQRPTFGAHGSFLMNNGLVENTVTWDFGTLAEDFEFSHKAWEMGFTCGAIHGIVREQSPSTIRDFLKQRRRWYMGIRDIQGLYYLPQMAVKLWSTGVFCLVATIINIPFSFLIDGSATPMWIAVLSSFCFAVFYWLYLWGLLFQELDSGTPWWKVIIRMLLGVVLQPFCSLAEAAAVVWAMASENVGKFEVIKK